MKRKNLLLLQFIAATTLLLSDLKSQQSNDTLIYYNIKEVKIEAFRSSSLLKELPYNIVVITKQNLSTTIHNDIGQLLKKSANIDIIEYQGIESSIGMRGFVPTSGDPYVKVLINGMPIGTKNLAAINTNNISQIEILKGPFSAFYGSGAMGGIVNIVTKESTGKISGLISSSIGSYKTYNVNVNTGGNLTEKINFDVYFNFQDQNKPYKTGNNNLLKLTEYEKKVLEEKSYGKIYENTEFEKYNGGIRIGINNSKNLKINLYNDLYYVPVAYLNGTFWGIYGQQKKDILRINNGLSVENKIKNHNIKVMSYYIIENTNIYNNTTDTAYITDKNQVTNYGLILQDLITFNNNKLILGLETNTKNYESERWENKITKTYPYLPDYLNNYSGLYTQLNFSQIKNLNISLGARLDYITFKVLPTDSLIVIKSKDNYISLNPNLTIKYNIKPWLNIHTSAGKAFLAPDAFKKTGIFSFNSPWGSFNYKGNSNLKPEKSWTIDGGIGFNKNNLNIDITFFNTWHNNLIVAYTIPPDTTSYKNSRKSLMNGIEISTLLNTKINSNLKVSGYFNGTFMFKTKVNIDTSWHPIRYVRNININSGITLEYKNISTTINARYSGNRYEDNWLYTYDWLTFERTSYKTKDGEDIRKELINEDVIKYPDFLTFDFNLNYRIKNFLVKLDVENIFDENYSEKDMYYMPGRFFRLTLGYQF